MINGKVEDDVDLTGAPEAVQEKANMGKLPGNTSLWLGCHPTG